MHSFYGGARTRSGCDRLRIHCGHAATDIHLSRTGLKANEPRDLISGHRRQASCGRIVTSRVRVAVCFRLSWASGRWLDTAWPITSGFALAGVARINLLLRLTRAIDLRPAGGRDCERTRLGSIATGRPRHPIAIVPKHGGAAWKTWLFTPPAPLRRRGYSKMDVLPGRLDGPVQPDALCIDNCVIARKGRWYRLEVIMIDQHHKNLA